MGRRDGGMQGLTWEEKTEVMLREYRQELRDCDEKRRAAQKSLTVLTEYVATLDRLIELVHETGEIPLDWQI